MKPIFAVVVLYKTLFPASLSYCALHAALYDRPHFGEQIDLLVVDNSPEPQSLPADFTGRYLHDGANPGLAKRYNYALAEAKAACATWLLLLDQDTKLTPAYFEEMVRLATQLGDDEEIVAIVPKLVSGGVLQSPHLPLFQASSIALDLSSRGVQEGKIRPYNSGALLRVKAIEAIGGFPEAYWLDYLDHATFDMLQAHGGKIYVMDARLEHELSAHRPDKYNDPAHAARHRNHLAAALRFYSEHGSSQEQRGYRRELAILALRALKHGHLGESARLAQALFGMPGSSK